MSIYEKLYMIQQDLKAPKGQYNSFGKYKYRSLEDILEAVKPILRANKCTLTISDTVICLGEGVDIVSEEQNVNGQRFYVQAVATLTDIETGESVINTAYARESFSKKGMDDSQITGTASSYARKYCLNGLFAIDDTKDADTDEFTKRTREEEVPPEMKELASEKELNSFKEACEKTGINYAEIWKQTGKAKDMSKAHLGLAQKKLAEYTNAQA